MTIPKEVRERLRLQPGDGLEFIERDGVIQVRKRVDPNVFYKYRGFLKHLAGRDPDELVEEMRGR